MSTTELNPGDKPEVGGDDPDKGKSSKGTADKAGAPTSEKTYTQAEMDAIQESVRQTERKRLADEKAKAELSEVDRLKLESEGLAKENGTLKERLEFHETMDAVQASVVGFVPRPYLKDVIQSASAEERKNPSALAKIAADRFNADKGVGVGAEVKAAKASTRAGTPANMGSAYEAMTVQELQAFGRRTDPEGQKIWRDFAKPELRRRKASPN